MGLRPCFLTASSEARTRAAAPSESGEALAAVTVPSLGLKTGFSVRVLDSLNWRRSVSQNNIVSVMDTHVLGLVVLVNNDRRLSASYGNFNGGNLLLEPNCLLRGIGLLV